MWVNEISIDKKYKAEFNYICNALERIKNLSYTKETTKDRYVFALATSNENIESVENQIMDIVKNVILVFIKRRIVFGGVDIDIDNYAKVALLGLIIHFDNNYEEKFLEYQMQDIKDYNIDAILNFRLKKLLPNWRELQELSLSLLTNAEENDFLDIAEFMNSTTGEKIGEAVVERSNENILLYTKKTLQNHYVLPLYNNNYYNLLDAIISVNPKILTISNILLPNDMLVLLRKLYNVKFV